MALIDILKRLKIVDSEDIQARSGPDGTRLYLANPPTIQTGGGMPQGTGESGGSIPAKVIQYTTTPTPTYLVSLYENGINNSATGTGLCYVLNLNFADPLPEGTWLMVNKSSLLITGGS